jgi:N-acetylmuramoyl-L-alanine amidase
MCTRVKGPIRRWAGCLAAGLIMLAAAAGAAERVPLGSRLGALGLRESFQPGDPPRAVFSNRWHRVEVEANSRRIVHDGVVIFLNGAVLREGSRWTVSAVDWAEGVGFPWISAPVKARRKKDLVLLDPGHGGADKGAISPRQLEEDRVTLDVAARVGKILAAKGVNVRYTRDKDRDLSLNSRIAIARKMQPDAFVAIHVNATANPAVKGVETFVMTAAGYSSTVGGRADRNVYDGNKNGVLNIRLARSVQDNLVQYTDAEDRGVKRARFAVIKGAPVPAVLVEIGFMTNPAEEGQLISRNYRDKIAAGVARGILSYLTTTRKPPARAK